MTCSPRIYQDMEKDEETQKLVSRSSVVARPMRTGDYWKAANSWINAFENDPLALYMRADGEKRARWQSLPFHILVLACWNHNYIIFTVEGGASLTVAENVPTAPKTPINRLKNKIAAWVLGSSGPKKTEEQTKRKNEVNRKFETIANEALGKRISEMHYIGLVATDPQYQGRGFASASVQAITTQADSENRACWLYSSNIANEGFYNSVGFQTVATFLLGDDNPEWQGKPIPIQLMVREPRTRAPSTQLAKADVVSAHRTTFLSFD